jgi:protein SCO1/2
MSLAAKTWISVLLAALFIYGSVSIWRAYDAHRRDAGAADAGADRPPAVRPLADFTFTDRSGQPVNLADLAGQAWVASFFFASCDGFCLDMNQTIARLAGEFGPKGVKFVSLTVDPDRDTPERLASYADALGADRQDWLFLTGEFSDLRDLGEGVFHVTVDKAEHSDRLILVDRGLEVRGTYRYREKADLAALKKELARLAAEGASSVPTAGADER